MEIVQPQSSEEESSPALLNRASRIQIHERAERLWIQQTKWLHILQQFLGPAVIIILSIAFQCAGALIQMVLWRSIKNNFAHRQAQEGPNPASGRRAQMSAQATALTRPAPLMWTPPPPWERRELIKPVEGGRASVIVRWEALLERAKSSSYRKVFSEKRWVLRQDCWFVTLGNSTNKNTFRHYFSYGSNTYCSEAMLQNKAACERGIFLTGLSLVANIWCVLIRLCWGGIIKG